MALHQFLALYLLLQFAISIGIYIYIYFQCLFPSFPLQSQRSESEYLNSSLSTIILSFYSPDTRELGISAIQSGQVAAVTLAGGQVYGLFYFTIIIVFVYVGKASLIINTSVIPHKLGYTFGILRTQGKSHCIAMYRSLLTKRSDWFLILESKGMHNIGLPSGIR